MKSQIHKYQTDLLSNQQVTRHHSHLQYSHYSFQQWALPRIIKKIHEPSPNLDHHQSNNKLIWIGNHKHSSVLSYFYAVLILCEHNQQLFFQFKQVIYKHSQFYLSLSQQKSLVQFLTNLKQSNNLNLLLINHRHIQQILIKIFQALYPNKRVAKLIELIQFSNQKLSFVKLEKNNQNVLEVKTVKISPENKNKIIKMYIICEKQCYFVYYFQPLTLKREQLSENIQNNIKIDVQQLQIERRKKDEAKMPSFLLKKLNGGDSSPHDPNKFKKYAQKCKRRIQFEEKRKQLIENIKAVNGANKSACNFKITQKISGGVHHQIPNLNEMIKYHKSLSKEKRKTLKKLNSQENLLEEDVQQMQQQKQSPRQDSRTRIQKQRQQFHTKHKIYNNGQKPFRKSDLEDEFTRKRMLSSLEKQQADDFIKSIEAMRKSTTHHIKNKNSIQKNYYTCKNTSNKKRIQDNEAPPKFFAKGKNTKKSFTQIDEKVTLIQNEVIN